MKRVILLFLLSCSLFGQELYFHRFPPATQIANKDLLAFETDLDNKNNLYPGNMRYITLGNFIKSIRTPSNQFAILNRPNIFTSTNEFKTGVLFSGENEVVFAKTARFNKNVILNNPVSFGTLGTFRLPVAFSTTPGDIAFMNNRVRYRDANGVEQIVATENFVNNNFDNYGMWSKTANNDIYYNANNVGIGTNNPMTNLHIADSNGVAILMRETKTSNTFVAVANTSEIVISTDPSLAFFVNGSERMRIANNGNVGIGEPNPSEKLHINGNALITGKLTANGGIDPPYISFSTETEESIKEFAKSLKENQTVMLWYDGAKLRTYDVTRNEFNDLAESTDEMKVRVKSESKDYLFEGILAFAVIILFVLIIRQSKQLKTLKRS